MGPRSRILIRELKLFGTMPSVSTSSTDDHVLLELSRKQDGTEAGSLSTVVVGISSFVSL